MESQLKKIKLKKSSKRMAKGDKGPPGPQGESLIGPRGPKPKLGVDYKIPKPIPGESVRGLRGPRGPKGESVKGPRGPIGKSIKGDPGKDADVDLILEEVFRKVDPELSALEKRLWDKIKILVAKTAQAMQRQMGGGMPRGSIRQANLTSQCNGSRVTFDMPEKFRAGSVQLYSTQFPRFYIPIIDFTEDVKNKTITMTLDGGNFKAPQTLQSLLAQYEAIN